TSPPWLPLPPKPPSLPVNFQLPWLLAWPSQVTGVPRMQESVYWKLPVSPPLPPPPPTLCAKMPCEAYWSVERAPVLSTLTFPPTCPLPANPPTVTLLLIAWFWSPCPGVTTKLTACPPSPPPPETLCAKIADDSGASV